MTRSIDRDLGRFKQILRGKVRDNLRKYITHGEMIGRTGRELVSIPVPAIEIPHFRHGQKGAGGIGQGEGDVGQPIGKGQGDPGDGSGQAGDQPGAHIREVEISLDELAAILGEVLELSDGDNWGEDNEGCLKFLMENLLPCANLFCYGQVESPYGSGDYLRELKKIVDKLDNLILSEIDSKDAIYDSIKEFLGTGK